METPDRNAPCPCGSTKKYKHCCQRKDQQIEQQRSQQMRMVPVWLQTGLHALRSNQLPHAQAVFQQILNVAPQHPDALHWINVIAYQQGAKKEALEGIEKLTDSHPHSALYKATKANMLKELGQYEQAILVYQQALRIKPDAPDVLNNYGTALALQMRQTEAIENYKKAIAIAPQYGEAYSNLAVSLEVQGLEQEARTTFSKALSLNPENPYALSGLSRLEYLNHDLAINLQIKALSINPNMGLWWMQLARLQTAKGDIAAAKMAITRGLVVDDFPELKIFDATLLPSIMGTVEEVMASRAEIETKLEELFRKNIKFRDNFTEFASNNFYLAYHGLNDRNLQSRLAEYYQYALPQLVYTAPHCKEPLSATQKRKVGFVSLYARASHSVGASFAGILSAIAADERFDVTLITGDSLTDEQMDAAYPALGRKRVLLPRKLALAQRTVAELALDVIVYLDIGMNVETYSLAFARLARTQCVLGGHPVTTGIPAMDYFLSADSIELPQAQDHYSERLVRLSHGAFYFHRPNVPTFDKSRTALNLPAAGHIYLCPMTLFKLHPEFDAAVEAILQVDKEGLVLFVETPGRPLYRELLSKRFDRTISAEVRDRVQFIPWISDKADFMRVLEASDVILDPFHFGIGTTAIWTTAVGTPFVTLPSEYMRGRVGLFYCKMLNLESECVASDKEDYVRKAVSFATRPDRRAEVKSRILARNDVFYENRQGIENVKTFIATCDLPVWA